MFHGTYTKVQLSRILEASMPHAMPNPSFADGR